MRDDRRASTVHALEVTHCLNISHAWSIPARMGVLLKGRDCGPSDGHAACSSVDATRRTNSDSAWSCWRRTPLRAPFPGAQSLFQGPHAAWPARSAPFGRARLLTVVPPRRLAKRSLRSTGSGEDRGGHSSFPLSQPLGVRFARGWSRPGASSTPFRRPSIIILRRSGRREMMDSRTGAEPRKLAPPPLA